MVVLTRSRIAAALATLMACGAACTTQEVFAQEVQGGCGSLANAYGPFDFRDYGNRQKYLAVVEQYHFTSDVRLLKSGKSSTLIGDLDYTLRAFPNHPAALDSVGRYALRGGMVSVDSTGSADCYFERAIAFAQDDPAVRVIYANYLFKRNHKEDARKQYEEALKFAPNSVEINYNAGLFFLEMGDVERARAHAKIAYDAGYPLDGLKNKISAAESRVKKP